MKLAVRIFDDGGASFFDNRISSNAPVSVLLNHPPMPVVNANQFVVYPSMLTLAASIQDDGLPAIDGRVKLDNDLVENAIRPMAIVHQGGRLRD